MGKRKAQVMAIPVMGPVLGAVIAIYLIAGTLIPLLVESTSTYQVTNETFNASISTTVPHTLLNLPLKIDSLSAYCAVDSSKTLTRNTNYTFDEGAGKVFITSLGQNATRDAAYEFPHYACFASSIGVNYQYVKAAGLPNIINTSEISLVKIGTVMAAVLIFTLIVATITV